MFVKIKSFFRQTFKVILSIYFLILVSMYFLQEKLIFHPKAIEKNFLYHFDVPFDEKYFEVEDLKLHALYFKTIDPKGVILYFHGNACELSQCGKYAVDLVKKTGWNVWMLDYPGYGKSEGSIHSESQLHHIARKAFSEVSDLGLDKVVVYGRSLGSGIAIRLAADLELSQKKEQSLNSTQKTDSNLNTSKRVSAVLLETPYFSIKKLALANYPFIPGFLLKYPFRSDVYIPNINNRIFIVHGSHDQVIPVEHARSLAQLGKNVRYVEVFGGTHDDMAVFSNYWTELSHFLNQL